MAEMEHVAGSPITWKLGDKEWEFSPLPMKIVGRFRRWKAQQSAQELLERDAKAKHKLLTKDERWQVIQEALNPKSDANPFTDGFDPEAISWVLWQSVLITQPDTDFDEFANLMSPNNMSELDSIAATVFAGGPMEELEKNEPGGEEATSADPPSDGPES